MTVATLEALSIAVGTLALVVVRPRGLNEGIAALLGGAATILFGLVGVREVVQLEASNWNIFLFFLGMIEVSGLADQSGVFDAIAYRAAHLARGRVALLYLAVFALGTIIAVLFANDSAALVLTPIVYALVVRLNLDPLPFVFATTFIADTASSVLPVSNPLNIIVADAFHLGLLPYVAHLWLPAVVVIIINITGFFLIFRPGVHGTFQMMAVPESRPGLPSTLVLLSLLAIAYLVASALQFPLGIVAVSGAAVLALNMIRIRWLDVPRLLRDTSWAIFAFIAGMLVVVRALNNVGITAQLGRALVHVAGTSALGAILAATFGSAVGSNMINNLPMALVMVAVIQPLHAGAVTRDGLIYGTILGCDLGPNLTHLGSLATFIWLFFLRRKGLEVSTLDYFRIGIMVTPLMLLGAALGLWLTSQW